MTLSGGVRPTQARSGCVGSWEENLLTKQSPKKVTRYHVYNQNGCDTRPSERCSTLVDKQINKSDDAIMWLYTSCKPHKKQAPYFVRGKFN